LNIILTSPSKELERTLETLQELSGETLTATMREAGALILKRGRDHIRAAGFASRRMIQGLQVEVEPKTGDSLTPSLRVFHRVGFAGIFEEGGTIQGRPLLWLPIEANLPRGRQRWSPRRFIRLIGPLRSVRGARRPILVGIPPGRSRAVPVFFGVSSVTIPDRWDIAGIVDNVVDEFERLLEKNMKAAA
jgi:hypothetical protein